MAGSASAVAAGLAGPADEDGVPEGVRQRRALGVCCRFALPLSNLMSLALSEN